MCLEAATGRTVWHRNFSGVITQPVVDETRLYVASSDGHSYALDRRLGEIRWKCEVGSPVKVAPALAPAHLFVVAAGGMVLRVHADTGEIQARYDVAKYTRTKPCLLSAPTVREDVV